MGEYGYTGYKLSKCNYIDSIETGCKKHLGAGAIIGIICGGIVFVGFYVIIYCLMRLRRREREAREARGAQQLAAQTE